MCLLDGRYCCLFHPIFSFKFSQKVLCMNDTSFSQETLKLMIGMKCSVVGTRVERTNCGRRGW
jgi:hypothetical protein